MTFQLDDEVIHRKTRTVYRITGTPDRVRLEADNTPAYAYCQATPGTTPDGPGHTIWVRSQYEMEDGRFVLNNPS